MSFVGVESCKLKVLYPLSCPRLQGGEGRGSGEESIGGNLLGGNLLIVLAYDDGAACGVGGEGG